MDSRLFERGSWWFGGSIVVDDEMRESVPSAPDVFQSELIENRVGHTIGCVNPARIVHDVQSISCVIEIDVTLTAHVGVGDVESANPQITMIPIGIGIVRFLK